MSILLKSFHSLLVDISGLTSLHLEAPVDLPMSWVLVEGPKLDKSLLGYLENPGLEQPEFPLWLKPLWNEFISKDDPRILKYLRQVLVFCYKAEFEPTDEQLRTAEMQFIETDESIRVWDDMFLNSDHGSKSAFFRTVRRIVSHVIYKVDWSNVTPSHGPGAVYPSRKPWKKSSFSVIYEKLQQLYPYDQFFCGLYSFWVQTMVESDSKIVEKSLIECALTAVPKDSRGPRLIAVHPAEAIWIQQGQRRQLERAITKHLSRNISFQDQTVNGGLALLASANREYCTLDLKEASDRLSNKFVEFLFGGAFKFISASRADVVRLLDKRVHVLEKFAPMGNCLTFPVQSLIFFSIVQASIECCHGTNCDDIYVFGDDIVFPSKYYDCVLRGLVRSGLIPNASKTFKTGFFRESCGVDAYRGTNVTPHRMKVHRIESYSDLVSICTLAKAMRVAGYDHCASYMYSVVRKRCTLLGKVLHLTNNVDAQGIHEYVSDLRTVILYERSLRYNSNLQRYETRNLLVRGLTIKAPIDDWYHLQDSLLRLTHMGDMISDRRTEYPVPYRTRPTYGWTPTKLI